MTNTPFEMNPIEFCIEYPCFDFGTKRITVII